MQLHIDRLDTPLGPLLIVADGTSLCAVEFGDMEDRLLPLLRRRFGPEATLTEADNPLGARSRLAAYLKGDLQAIDDLPADGGGTLFQSRVWAALRKIPPGKTETYGGLAARLGMPRAARAVGAANGQNPINIIVPCHRVIGADGSLTGYGGELWRKRWLLAHEGALA